MSINVIYAPEYVTSGCCVSGCYERGTGSIVKDIFVKTAATDCEHSTGRGLTADTIN